MTRKRILFVAEDITLSQVVRLRSLAGTLDPARYEVIFACARFPELIFAGTSFARRRIHSRSGPKVLRDVERGTSLYDERTLAGYVREEIALLSELRPDLVVGDLRLSLSVSAPVCGVPAVSLINAFWHRRAIRERLPAPDFPVLRWLPRAQADRYFEMALPLALRWLAQPVNALRKRHGLTPLGDLVDVLGFGDAVLYPDVPELTPIARPSAHECFLGPVIWSPPLPPPQAYAAFRDARPCVYLTLGSSGSLSSIAQVLRVLRKIGVQVLVATAGRFAPSELPGDVLAADYLPGDWAAAQSDLVICNGGASTAYQALAAGVPVLGLPSNIDQWLAMTAIEQTGAGVALRARDMSDAALQETITKLIGDQEHRLAARRMASAFAGYDPAARFRDAIDSVGGAVMAGA